MLALFIILTIAFASTSLFLGYELLKKFTFMRDFVEGSNQMVIWDYSGNRNPGMHNIVLRGSKPFCALVGFKLQIPLFKWSGYDYYGFVRSNEDGVAVIATYLGKGTCTFQFFANTNLQYNQITATSTEAEQQYQPDVRYPPHWYQRLGFYG